MKRTTHPLWIAVSASLLLGAAGTEEPSAAEAVAQAAGPGSPGVEASAPADASREKPGAVASGPPTPVVYRPPRRGTPRARVAGGVRGAKALPSPLALAPEHVALTTRKAPSLFWQVDDAAPAGEEIAFVFTLIAEDDLEPLIEAELSPPPAAGIYRIRLAEHGVTLERDVEYSWAVSLVVDPDRRAQDLVTTGYLMRVDEPGLAGRQPSAALYADLGLWYDALESLSDAIEAAPGDREATAQRSSLLRQAGLEAAVD